MSNSVVKSQPARSELPVMQRSSWSRRKARGFMAARDPMRSRGSARAAVHAGTTARSIDRFCDLRSSCGPSRSLLPVGGGCWPAAGYSGCRDPGRVRIFDGKPGCRGHAIARALGRSNDQALAALAARIYVPWWRIGFLIPPATVSPTGRCV